LDCGGKSDAAPLFSRMLARVTGAFLHPKAPSPLRFAGAVQKLAPSPTGHKFAKRLGLRQSSGAFGRRRLEEG
jgi:hypothetical protein